MENERMHIALEKRFRKIVRKDKKIKNAYMFVHAEKQKVHLNIAEGATGDFLAHPEQPFFIASIDKLFTAVLIASLEEKEKNYPTKIPSLFI